MSTFFAVSGAIVWVCLSLVAAALALGHLYQRLRFRWDFNAIGAAFVLIFIEEQHRAEARRICRKASGRDMPSKLRSRWVKYLEREVQP